jgi:hypothetical protein
MAHGHGTGEKPLYSLIPLEDFKALLGVDDREDTLCRYCLVTATFTIEQYCKRRLLRKKHIETLPFYGDYILPLREYPVREIMACYYAAPNSIGPEILEDDLYHTIPDYGTADDLPYCLAVSPAVRLVRGEMAIRVHYRAGYIPGEVPADLASACLELAAWNMARYRGRRIGITGAVRGSGKDGEHLENSMPENVRLLLEPYKRRTI